MLQLQNMRVLVSVVYGVCVSMFMDNACHCLRVFNSSVVHLLFYYFYVYVVHMYQFVLVVAYTCKKCKRRI